MQFAKFSSAGLVIKTIRNNEPQNLKDILCKTLYTERRKPGRLRFYDNSKTKAGYQSIENRIAKIFAELDFDHFPYITDHNLRINLKESLNFIKPDLNEARIDLKAHQPLVAHLDDRFQR